MKQESTAQPPKSAITGEAALLPILRASKLGIEFPAETTFEQWAEIGLALQRADSALMWCLGDWLAFGARRDGVWGQRYQNAVAESGYAYSTCQNACYVSTSVSFSVRTEMLSWEHHKLVAPLEPKGRHGQEYWLIRAVKYRLSTRALAASIKAGRVITAEEIKESAQNQEGLPTVLAVRTAFERALNQARRVRDVDEWAPRQRELWKMQLKPIVDLYARL